MVSFEVLKTGIDAIKNMMEKEDKWQKTFDEMFDGHIVPQYYDEPINAICKMLEKLFNDKPNDVYGSHLSWWIFEADFGRNKNFADSVTDKDGKNIPMRTVEDLYNYYCKYTLKEKDE